MFEHETANHKFASELKKLRLLFNLTQKQVADIVGITQSVYGSYESGRSLMGLNDANEIAQKAWGVDYCSFVKFSGAKISVKKLPVKTQKAIEESKKQKIKEQEGVLAKELDRLVDEGYLNNPITSKQLLTHMHPDLQLRKSSEITNLLNKSPRNKYIIQVDKKDKANLYQLKEFAEK